METMKLYSVMIEVKVEAKDSKDAETIAYEIVDEMEDEATVISVVEEL